MIKELDITNKSILLMISTSSFLIKNETININTDTRKKILKKLTVKLVNSILTPPSSIPLKLS